MSMEDMLFPKEIKEGDIVENEQSPKNDELPTSEKYWLACDKMLTSWGPYVGRQDLLDNATDSLTKHKVWPVVQSKFGGSIYRLENRVKELKAYFNADYNAYVQVCAEYGVDPVPLKWMRSHLWDGKELKSIRERCRRYGQKPDKYPAKSLKDLPPRKSRKGAK